MMLVGWFLSCLLGASASDRMVLSSRGTNEVQGKLLMCTGDFDSLQAGSSCVITFSKATKGSHQLRATEPSVGYANVARQVSTHFPSKKKAAKWFGKHSIPAVVGESHLYITDYHHHMLAISQNSDLWELEITIKLLADFRALGDDFWPKMRANHYSLLFYNDPADPFAMPLEVGPEQLPQDWELKNFSDNIWRSLAAFAGHYEPVENRCYVKTCDFFVDYQWAYVFQLATEFQLSLWPQASDAQSLHAKLAALPRAPSIKDVDLSQWEDLGAQVLPLCRSSSIESFPLLDIFGMPTLKGWSTAPLPEDPDCASSTLALV